MALQIKYSFNAETEKTVVLEQQIVIQACEMVIAAMEKELPEEVHTMEVFDYILDEAKKILHSKTIKLKFQDHYYF